MDNEKFFMENFSAESQRFSMFFKILFLFIQSKSLMIIFWDFIQINY